MNFFIEGMNLWLWAALAMMLALIPAGIACFRATVDDRLVALELAGAIATLEMVLIAEGFGRPSFYDLPLVLAFLAFGSGMVFVRFLQRWL
ncbi:MAG: hypothetical protein JO353_03500 [Phycisphaerae bacterium]|nr:hypothetical protein [Phycisphaerae bacterium]